MQQQWEGPAQRLLQLWQETPQWQQHGRANTAMLGPWSAGPAAPPLPAAKSAPGPHPWSSGTATQASLGAHPWSAGTAAPPVQHPETAYAGQSNCEQRFCEVCQLALPSDLQLAAAHYASEGHLLRSGVSRELLQAAQGCASAKHQPSRAGASSGPHPWSSSTATPPAQHPVPHPWSSGTATPPIQHPEAPQPSQARFCEVCQLDLPSELQLAAAHYASEGHLLRSGVSRDMLQAVREGTTAAAPQQQSTACAAAGPAMPGPSSSSRAAPHTQPPEDLALTQPPLPLSPPPPLPPGSPPPSVIKLAPMQPLAERGSKQSAAAPAATSPRAGRAAASSIAHGGSVKATPTKSSLVPDFLKAVWSALSPRKARPASEDTPRKPSLLGDSARASQCQGQAVDQAAGGLEEGEMSKVPQPRPAAATAKPTAAAAAVSSSSAGAGKSKEGQGSAPAEELEEGEIPIPGPGEVPAGAAFTAAGEAPAASPSTSTAPAPVAAAGQGTEGSQKQGQGSPARSRSSPGAGKKKGKGSKVMAALRRTLRGRNKKEAAARKPAKLERAAAPQVESLAASLAQQAQHLRTQLAALSLAPGSSSASAFKQEEGEEPSPLTPSGAVESQLAALSSQLSQLTLCLQTIQGAGAGNPFALSMSPPSPQQASNVAGKVLVIFDTNVLLDYLPEVREWWERLQAAGPACAHVMLLMPLAVIRELDGLKNSFRHYFSARRAIGFVHDKLLGKAQYRGQREGELHRGMWRRGDDGIIDCCLYFQERGAQVEVVTLDRNLQLRVANEGMIYHTHSTALAAFSRWELAAQLQRHQQHQQQELAAAGQKAAQPAGEAPRDSAGARRAQPAAPTQPAATPQAQKAQRAAQSVETAREGGELSKLLAAYASPAPEVLAAPEQRPPAPQTQPKAAPALQPSVQAQQGTAQAALQQIKPHYQKGVHSGRSFFWDVVQTQQGKENR